MEDRTYTTSAPEDYVGRHRLFRKVRIEGGNYGYRLEPVLYGGDPLYVPRHYRNPVRLANKVRRIAAEVPWDGL